VPPRLTHLLIAAIAGLGSFQLTRFLQESATGTAPLAEAGPVPPTGDSVQPASTVTPEPSGWNRGDSIPLGKKTYSSPVVDVESLTELDRAVLAGTGPAKMAVLGLKQRIHQMLVRLINSGKEACTSANVSDGDGSRGIGSGLLVSADVISGGRKILLSAVTISPWNGAPAAPSLLDCMRDYAAKHANDPAIDTQPARDEPVFNGRHQVVVHLDGICSASAKRSGL
jgi:hypothetical protein